MVAPMFRPRVVKTDKRKQEPKQQTKKSARKGR